MIHNDLLRSLDEAFLRFLSTYHAIQHQIKVLESEGLTDERPAWYKQRYLYMVGPAKGSNRRRPRRYIGIEAQRQAEALAPFQRTLKHGELVALFDEIEICRRDTVKQIEAMALLVAERAQQFQERTENALR